MYDFVIIGGGIVGLSTAFALSQQYPQCRLAVVEKESSWAAHQTGHNSGVIHSGVYYRPGSRKAKFCREGNEKMVDFCQTYQIPYQVCGKVIVATNPSELPRLEALYQRGLANGIKVTSLCVEEVREIEPHVKCLAGIFVPTAGIVDYHQVCQKLVELIAAKDATLLLNTQVLKLIECSEGQTIITNQGEISTRYVINCGGLQSDRLTRLAGIQPKARIVPFRGEYYNLKPEKCHLVKGLIYPVPDPQFPFLGVHFTRSIDGGVHAGPNAVLSLKREGYNKTDVDFRDLAEVLTYPGFWKLALRHADMGLAELWRSFSKEAFVRSLQKLIPSIQADDLEVASCGIRAQALQPDGKLVEDFEVLKGQTSLHVCNAPSPAATASLAIGRAIVQQIPDSVMGDQASISPLSLSIFNSPSKI